MLRFTNAMIKSATPAHSHIIASAVCSAKNQAGDETSNICLLYTSDAADEEDSVDLGGRSIIKKKENKKKKKKMKM